LTFTKAFFVGNSVNVLQQKWLVTPTKDPLRSANHLFLRPFRVVFLASWATGILHHDRLDALCTDTPPISSLNYIKCLLQQIRKERSPLASDRRPAQSFPLARSKSWKHNSWFCTQR